MEIHLQTFGSRLRVKEGLFQIVVPDITGAGDHIEDQYAAHQVEAILLQKGTSVSTDALLLAVEQGTDIVVLDQTGFPQGRIWTTKPNNSVEILKGQLAHSETTKGLKIARQWICEKIHARLEHLRKLKGYRSAEKQQRIEKAEKSIGELLAKIHNLTITDTKIDAAPISISFSPITIIPNSAVAMQ